MYWSAWGLSNGIERSAMNGQGRILMQSWYSWLGGPHGIILDIQANRLYWLGEHDNAIEYTDLDQFGGPVHSLVSNSIYLLWPHDLAFDNEYVYWIDTYMDVVARANKSTGQNVELLVEGLVAPRGLLRISARDRSPGTGDFYIVRSAL